MSGRFAILPSTVVSDRRIGDAAFRVLAALSTYADRDGWCWPSQPTLAEDVGTSRWAIRRQLIALEVAGYIEARRRMREDGSETSKMYRLLYDLDRRTTRPSPPAPDAPPPGALRAGDRHLTRPDRSHPNDPNERKKNHGVLERVIRRD